MPLNIKDEKYWKNLHSHGNDINWDLINLTLSVWSFYIYYVIYDCIPIICKTCMCIFFFSHSITNFSSAWYSLLIKLIVFNVSVAISLYRNYLIFCLPACSKLMNEIYRSCVVIDFVHKSCCIEYFLYLVWSYLINFEIKYLYYSAVDWKMRNECFGMHWMYDKLTIQTMHLMCHYNISFYRACPVLVDRQTVWKKILPAVETLMHAHLFGSHYSVTIWHITKSKDMSAIL